MEQIDYEQGSVVQERAYEMIRASGAAPGDYVRCTYSVKREERVKTAEGIMSCEFANTRPLNIAQLHAGKDAVPLKRLLSIEVVYTAAYVRSEMYAVTVAPHSNAAVERYAEADFSHPVGLMENLN